MSAIRVSFDTNTYSSIASPKPARLFFRGWWPINRDHILSKRRRVAWCYIQWCIRRGRIKAAISEAAFAAEVLPNVSRISFLLTLGTSKAATPPVIPEGRRQLIQKAFALGFKALHGARIVYGEIVGIQANQWAIDGRSMTFSILQSDNGDSVSFFDTFKISLSTN